MSIEIIKIEKLVIMVSSDRRLGQKQASDALKISYERIHYKIHVNLDIHKIAARRFPNI